MRATPTILECLDRARREGRLTERVASVAAPAPEPLSEKDFMQAVIDLATRNGWRHYHTHDARKSVAGFPDLLLLRGPRQVVAELKVPPNGTDAAQDAWLDAFRDAGVPTFVWYQKDWPEIERVLGA